MFKSTKEHLNAMITGDNYQTTDDPIGNWASISMVDNAKASASDLQAYNNQLLADSAAVQYENNLDLMNQANAFTAYESQLNRDFQTNANQIAMNFEAEQAKLLRDWQNQQRSTAYQTAVSDMKAAGLNPILAANGSGAALGSGAMASGVSSAGSSGSSVSASVSKADVDYTTSREIYKMAVNAATNMLGGLFGLAGTAMRKK